MALKHVWARMRKVFPMTRGAFWAFALLTVVNVYGFVQVKHNADADAERSVATDVKLCHGLDRANAGARNFIHTVVSATPAPRPGETPEQYALRQEQIRQVLVEADRAFPDLPCPGDKRA